MYPLLESIKVADRQIRNWEYHLDRMIRSSTDLWGCLPPVDEIPILEALDFLSRGLYKLKIVYSSRNFCFEYIPYQFPSIKKLKIVNSYTINYNYKFHDRSSLGLLYAQKGSADDIIIVKNGFITDSYYCNLAFLRQGLWLTPLVPLLKGTKRAQLIDNGLITQENILVHDLLRFDKVMLFNAMIDFGEIIIEVKDISIH